MIEPSVLSSLSTEGLIIIVKYFHREVRFQECTGVIASTYRLNCWRLGFLPTGGDMSASG